MITKVLAVIPKSFRNRLIYSSDTSKVLKNFFWLFFDKVVRMGVGLTVGVFVARYLGPVNFGIWNYATSFIALFIPLTTLGIDSILIKDLLNHPEQESKILSTAFIIRLVSGILSILLVIITAGLLRSEIDLEFQLIVISSFYLSFYCFDVIDLLFQAKLLSKYSVISKNSAFLLSNIYKITLVVLNKSLIFFVIGFVLESLLGAVFLLIALKTYKRKFIQWNFDISYLSTLIKEGFPLFLSGFMVMIYMKIDMVMLGEMVGNESVGNYAAAVRLSEVWYFLPLIISSSLFPNIIKSKNVSHDVYMSKVQTFYDRITWLALIIGLVVSLNSWFLVDILFGEQYADAALILSIHIWASVFVFQGVANSQFLVIEGLTKISFYQTMIGCIINICLNFLLIPAYGGVGAALATLVAYFFSGYFNNLLFKSSREAFYMLTRSFNVVRVFRGIITKS